MNALVHHDPAVDHARHAVGADIGADAARQREIGLVLARADAHGQHQVLGRDLLRLDVDDAPPVSRPGVMRRAHQPRPLDAFRAERNGDASALGPRHAQIDVGEGPLLAVALIVDGEIAALEADLGEIAAIESAGVETLDPGEQRREVGNAARRDAAGDRSGGRRPAIGGPVRDRATRRCR